MYALFVGTKDMEFLWFTHFFGKNLSWEFTHFFRRFFWTEKLNPQRALLFGCMVIMIVDIKNNKEVIALERVVSIWWTSLKLSKNPFRQAERIKDVSFTPSRRFLVKWRSSWLLTSRTTRKPELNGEDHRFEDYQYNHDS